MRRANTGCVLLAAVTLSSISSAAVAQVTFAQPFSPMSSFSMPHRVFPGSRVFNTQQPTMSSGFVRRLMTISTPNGPQTITVNVPIQANAGTVTRSFIPSPPPGAPIGQMFWFDNFPTTPIATPGGTIVPPNIPSPPPGAPIGQMFWFGGASRPMAAPAPQPRPR